MAQAPAFQHLHYARPVSWQMYLCDTGDSWHAPHQAPAQAHVTCLHVCGIVPICMFGAVSRQPGPTCPINRAVCLREMATRPYCASVSGRSRVSSTIACRQHTHKKTCQLRHMLYVQRARKCTHADICTCTACRQDGQQSTRTYMPAHAGTQHRCRHTNAYASTTTTTSPPPSTQPRRPTCNLSS